MTSVLVTLVYVQPGILRGSSQSKNMLTLFFSLKGEIKLWVLCLEMAVSKNSPVVFYHLKVETSDRHVALLFYFM